MKTIDLKQIIKDRKLNTNELATYLFPHHRHPAVALLRVKNKKGVLDANQISKLALFTGLTITELFGPSESWKAKKVSGLYTFTNGDFRAELDTETWLTKVFDKHSMFHESVIHNGSTALSEYLKNLNKIISNYTNNGKTKRSTEDLG